MIELHEEVLTAMRDGRPVVALESAVITAGLPEDLALEMARQVQRAVRDAGAIPATVAVVEGRLQIGLDDAQLERFAGAAGGAKASVRDLAALMATGGTAGTTVSATLHASTLGPRPIQVMATGGIGGVHRGWTQHPDVSADLRVLACTPACVVASGCKSILDVAATVEALEALAITVLGWRTDEMPLFYCRGRSDLPVPRRVDNLSVVADICRLAWSELGSRAGVLLANPVDPTLALDASEIEGYIEQAETEARRAGLTRGRRTPHLLQWVAERTDGRAVAANQALLRDNARLASELAVVMAD